MRALQGSQHYSSTLTTQECSQLCEGYTYYGVEYAGECYCGNEIASGAFRAAAVEDCDVPCLGDSTQMCGGSMKLNVFSRTAGPVSSAPGHPEPADIVYPYVGAGCYHEPADARILTYLVAASSKMTKEMCFYNCYARGFKHAGLENGNECWCGNEIGAGDKVADDLCALPTAMACHGDQNQPCGGPLILELFSTPDN